MHSFNFKKHFMINNFKNLSLLIIAIVGIYGKCNKVDVNRCNGDCYNIMGVVKDSLSGTPITNAEIELASINGANFYSGTYGKGYTNSSGLYNLFYPSKQVDFKDFYLLITIKAPADYIADEISDLKSISYKIYANDSPKINIPIIRNASFFKNAFLNIRVIKTTNGKSLNSFYSRFGRFGTNSVSTFPSTNNLDTTYHFETAGDIKSYLNWETKNSSGIINKFSDSTIISPSQTKEFVIRL